MGGAEANRMAGSTPRGYVALGSSRYQSKSDIKEEANSLTGLPETAT